MIQFLHILVNSWWCHYFSLAILTDAQWYPIVVLVCISLVANGGTIIQQLEEDNLCKTPKGVDRSAGGKPEKCDITKSIGEMTQRSKESNHANMRTLLKDVPVATGSSFQLLLCFQNESHWRLGPSSMGPSWKPLR